MASKKSEREKDDARLVSLEDVSTSKLKSYAAVLERALDKKNADADQGSSKNQEVHSLDDGHEEMDISDEEDGEDLKLKSKSNQDVQELKPERPAGEFEEIAFERSPSDVAKQNSDKSEKEKHSLKLAELRAKAKLARAKLRIAEQKQARGNITRESLDLSSKNGGEVQRSNYRPTSSPTQFVSSFSPLPAKPSLAAIKICSLVIPDVALTGPDDEVRFVDSVYSIREHEEKDDPGANTIIHSSSTKLTNSFQITPAQRDTQVVQPATATTALSSEEKRKKTASLHQQLQLRRLQLEIMKKKKEALEKKKKKRESLEPLPSVANKGGERLASGLMGQHSEELSADEDASSHREEVPLKDKSKNREEGSLQDENSQSEQSKGGGNNFMVRNSDSAELNLGDPVNVQDQHSDRKQDHAAVSGSQTRDQLIRRQKELKEKNEIANLRNLIHRQRDLLQVQGRELTDSSTQLQSCVDNIRTKQESLDQSERRLEEMKKRKRRLERMVLRATEQLITVRKALGECRRENH